LKEIWLKRLHSFVLLRHKVIPGKYIYIQVAGAFKGNEGGFECLFSFPVPYLLRCWFQ